MKLVDTEFECFACLATNPVRVRKPKIFEPVITNYTCEVCDSKFAISFKRAVNKPGQLVYGFVQSGVHMSKKGMEEFLKRKHQTNSGLDKPQGGEDVR